MSSIDTAIEITEYCLKQSRKNRVDWYSDSFISNSYSIWAAKELLTRLNNNRDIPPLITLENFEELMDEYRNPEGYPDPTAYSAINNVEKAQIESKTSPEDEERFHKLLNTIFTICELAGFHIEGRIAIKDCKTGKIWR